MTTKPTLGRYISRNASTIMVRVPGYPQTNFHHLQVEAAMAFRDQLVAEQGLRLAGPNRRLGRAKSVRQANSSQPDLPVGISIDVRVRRNTKGEVRYEYSYRAQIRVAAGPNQARRTLTRNFSWRKYGKTQALLLATNWRLAMVARHYQS